MGPRLRELFSDLVSGSPNLWNVAVRSSVQESWQPDPEVPNFALYSGSKLHRSYPESSLCCYLLTSNLQYTFQSIEQTNTSIVYFPSFLKYSFACGDSDVLALSGVQITMKNMRN